MKNATFSKRLARFVEDYKQGESFQITCYPKTQLPIDLEIVLQAFSRAGWNYEHQRSIAELKEVYMWLEDKNDPRLCVKGFTLVLPNKIDVQYVSDVTNRGNLMLKPDFSRLPFLKIKVPKSVFISLEFKPLYIQTPEKIVYLPPFDGNAVCETGYYKDSHSENTPYILGQYCFESEAHELLSSYLDKCRLNGIYI